MSKLVKTSTEIVPAGDFTDKLAKVIESDKPAISVVESDICRRCGGVGSISVPGELADATCPRCMGTGVGENLWKGIPYAIVCGGSSPTIDGRLLSKRVTCTLPVGHEGRHGGGVEVNTPAGPLQNWLTWENSRTW